MRVTSAIKGVDNYVHDRAFGVFHEAVRKVERLGQLSEVWYERDSPAGSLQFEEVAQVEDQGYSAEGAFELVVAPAASNKLSANTLHSGTSMT